MNSSDWPWGSPVNYLGLSRRLSPWRLPCRACATLHRYIWNDPPQSTAMGAHMGRVLIGVVIGVILVVWLLASCVQALF